MSYGKQSDIVMSMLNGVLKSVGDFGRLVSFNIHEGMGYRNVEAVNKEFGSLENFVIMVEQRADTLEKYGLIQSDVVEYGAEKTYTLTDVGRLMYEGNISFTPELLAQICVAMGTGQKECVMLMLQDMSGGTEERTEVHGVEDDWLTGVSVNDAVEANVSNFSSAVQSDEGTSGMVSECKNKDGKKKELSSMGKESGAKRVSYIGSLTVDDGQVLQGYDVDECFWSKAKLMKKAKLTEKMYETLFERSYGWCVLPILYLASQENDDVNSYLSAKVCRWYVGGDTCDNDRRNQIAYCHSTLRKYDFIEYVSGKRFRITRSGKKLFNYLYDRWSAVHSADYEQLRLTDSENAKSALSSDSAEMVDNVMETTKGILSKCENGESFGVEYDSSTGVLRIREEAEEVMVKRCEETIFNMVVEDVAMRISCNPVPAGIMVANWVLRAYGITDDVRGTYVGKVVTGEDGIDYYVRFMDTVDRKAIDSYMTEMRASGADKGIIVVLQSVFDSQRLYLAQTGVTVFDSIFLAKECVSRGYGVKKHSLTLNIPMIDETFFKGE